MDFPGNLIRLGFVWLPGVEPSAESPRGWHQHRGQRWGSAAGAPEPAQWEHCITQECSPKKTQTWVPWGKLHWSCFSWNFWNLLELSELLELCLQEPSIPSFDIPPPCPLANTFPGNSSRDRAQQSNPLGHPTCSVAKGFGSFSQTVNFAFYVVLGISHHFFFLENMWGGDPSSSVSRFWSIFRPREKQPPQLLVRSATMKQYICMRSQQVKPEDKFCSKNMWTARKSDATGTQGIPRNAFPEVSQHYSMKFVSEDSEPRTGIWFITS